MPSESEPEYGQSTAWRPERPRWRLFPILVSWLGTGVALMVAAGLLPGVHIDSFLGAMLVAAIAAALNAVIPPVLAALRLPATLVTGFLLVLFADAGTLLLADLLTDGILRVDSFGWALLASLVVAAVSVVLDVLLGSDDTYSMRIARRIAHRQGIIATTDVPGIVFLEIDGLALPVLRRAMRDGNAPNMARWMADGTHRLSEWETDLSSQTGASQAGILLGSNEDIAAFRWVEKETATMMTCSAPQDCAEIERRHATGVGLLVDGGSSRGNLLSGEAEDVILTVSRMEAEKKANPGYRAFLANGDNVTRTLVLFIWEVILEWTAALRASRRDVRPRGHRGGIYPLMRAALCVFVRDLIVSGVLTDMLRGRPAVYATFSSYDEVAHHSGLERADTLEALRKLDDRFAEIERARRYAPRPYEIVVLSDHGQTQGATFKQRNGYGLDELVERSLSQGDVSGIAGGDEQSSMVGLAVSEATGKEAKRAKNDVSDRGRRRARLGQPRTRLPHGGTPPADPRGARDEAPEAPPRAARAPTRRLAARPLLRARTGRARRPRRPLPRRRSRRGRGPARTVLAHRTPAPAAHRRLRARRRHHGRQLLRRRARRGLRLRGADLLPRRHRRPADPPLHPPPHASRDPRRAHHRRRERARHPRRLARDASRTRERRDAGAGRAAGGRNHRTVGEHLIAPRVTRRASRREPPARRTR